MVKYGEEWWCNHEKQETTGYFNRNMWDLTNKNGDVHGIWIYNMGKTMSYLPPMTGNGLQVYTTYKNGDDWGIDMK